MDIYLYPRKKNIIIRIKDAKEQKTEERHFIYVQRIET